MPKAKTTWIAVADGARARIFAESGGGTALNQVMTFESPTTRQLSRDLKSDRPGRGFARAGGVPHGLQPRHDAQRLAKRKFAGIVADLLNEATQAKSFDRLILVAPSRTLGELRRRLRQDAHDKIVAELPLDLTKTPDDALPRHVAELVRPRRGRA